MGLGGFVKGLGGSKLLGAAGTMYGEYKAGKRRKKAEGTAADAIKVLERQFLADPQKALQFLQLTDRSSYEDIPPEMRKAAEAATNALLQRGSGSGLDIQSRQALQEASRGAGQTARSARQAVLAEYAQRMGGGSGGAERLAAELSGTQAAYGNMAQSQGTASAAAEQRRLEANVLASRAAQQQQQIEQNAAQARDSLRRFNVGAKQNLLTGQSNALGAIAGGFTNLANMQSGHAQEERKKWQNIGKAGDTMVTGIGSAVAGGWGA